jgi:hypothetical protein
MAVKIQEMGKSIRVEAPFHEGFTREAHQIGGVWTKIKRDRYSAQPYSPGYWTFAIETRDLLKMLLFRFYGHIHKMEPDVINLKITWTKDVSGNPVMAGDRIVCQNGVVGENVLKLAGEIDGSWESKKTKISAGTAVMVLSFPRDEAERLLSEESSNRICGIENKDPSIKELQDRRNRLSNLIAEIDRQILLKEKAK